MKTTKYTPNEELHCRMDTAEYTRTVRDLWCGTRVGFDMHALQRSIGRFYRFMSYELLLENVLDILYNEELSEYLLELPFGAKFVAMQEKDGFTIFAQIGYNSETKMNECYIYSVFVRDDEHPVVFVEEGNQGLYKILKSGEVMQNPTELKFRILGRERKNKEVPTRT